MIEVSTYEGWPWSFLVRRDGKTVTAFALLGRDEAIEVGLSLLGYVKGLRDLPELPQGREVITFAPPSATDADGRCEAHGIRPCHWCAFMETRQ